MRRLAVAWLAVGLTLGVAWSGAGRWGIGAQERPAAPPPASAPVPARDPAVPTVQEALLRPATLPFREETTLEKVAVTLQQSLQAPVVLDRAALGRQGLTPDSTVKLYLERVRLKTGLQLLLDQVGLTYRVIPEDNLLVLTDLHGADDPSQRVLSELQSLHRDLHALRDAVDDLYDLLDPSRGGSGGTIREPTIIEEVPKDKAESHPGGPPSRTRSG